MLLLLSASSRSSVFTFKLTLDYTHELRTTGKNTHGFYVSIISLHPKNKNEI